MSGTSTKKKSSKNSSCGKIHTKVDEKGIGTAATAQLFALGLTPCLLLPRVCAAYESLIRGASRSLVRFRRSLFCSPRSLVEFVVIEAGDCRTTLQKFLLQSVGPPVSETGSSSFRPSLTRHGRMEIGFDPPAGDLRLVGYIIRGWVCSSNN